MNNQWLLYASIITGVSVVLLYIAYSTIDRDVLNQLRPLNIIRNSSSYQDVLNLLSQETFGNKSYEESIGWMFNNRMVEDNITYQGYALGWDYYEGQTCAARNLVGLQHWATSLNFGVVEPFVYQSYFRTSQFNNKKALRLSDYFDIDIWNHKVVTTIPYGTPLVRWEHFIKNAARQLVVVHIVMNTRKDTKVYVNDEVKEGSCWQPRGFTNTTFSKFGFYVARQICFRFNVRSPIPIDEFNKYILGPFKANSISIIFTFVPGVSRGRINIFESEYHHMFVDWLNPSRRVINDARKYVSLFLKKPYVAVSLRTVKMAISVRSMHPTDIKKATNIVVNKCVDKIAENLSSIPGQHFMTIDIGTFGDPRASSYMSSITIKQIINRLINITYNNSWNQSVWEHTFIEAANGISDSGYIASIQKEIVSHAASVIIAGGGSFQNSMLRQHKLRSSKKSVVLQPCSIRDLYPVNMLTS